MTSFKDWVFSQVLSRSIVARESFLSPESRIEGLGNQGSSQASEVLTLPHHPPPDAPRSYSDHHATQDLSHAELEISSRPSLTEEMNLGPLANVEALQIKFLRLIRRFGPVQDNATVAKVLYRIHLATLLRAGESDLKRAHFRGDRALAIAAEQEENGLPELDFSLKILVLGKTGVGKSSTINSILGESKVVTNAFQPATNRVQEIVGTISGIKVSFIDTPGLLPSSTNSDRKNRKILQSVKRFIQKSRPDVVLYFERLDSVSNGSYDFALLKLITGILGPSIWFCTNVVMTHSSSALPEGQNGYPVSYESYVSFCTQVVQHHIHQAILDTKLENPVILVENHPHCRVNTSGKKVLPNGQAWVSQFMFLCICTKILGDVSSLLNFDDSIHIGPLGSSRLPSMPHLLSSTLKHRVKLSLDGDDGGSDELALTDMEEDDEYDQLPPIRILTKAQFKKLSPSQKRDYLDELDYRETLYLKKQLKQEYMRRQQKHNDADDNPDNQEEPPEAVPLADMAIPPSFDSDSPVHRFRGLVMSNQLLARPVLDPQGWDHDVGFDGINLEVATEIRKNIVAYVVGQMSKDKQDFNIHCESTAAFVDPKGHTYSVGLDVQSASNDLVCSVRSNAKLKSFNHQITECGVSVMSFGNNYYVGAKIEDSVSTESGLNFKMNAGGVSGAGQVAYGGGFDVTIKGKDHPVRDDRTTLGMTVLSYKKDAVLGGSIESNFRLNRSTRMSINANLNNQRMGQVCVKINSSEHMEIALVAAIAIIKGLLKKKPSNNAGNRETS